MIFKTLLKNSKGLSLFQTTTNNKISKNIHSDFNNNKNAN